MRHDLALPVPDPASRLCQTIVDRFAMAVHESLIAALVASSETHLAQLVESAPALGQGTWRPELGVIRQSVRAGNAKAGAVLWLAAFADSGAEFEVTLPAGSRLLLDGNAWQFESEVTAAFRGATLRLRSTTTFELTRRAGVWVEGEFQVNAGAWPRFVSGMEGVGVSGAFPDPFRCNARAWHMAEEGDSSIGVPQAYADAFGLIGNSQSPFARWIASTVAGVVLTSGDAEVSSTDPSYPGLVILKNAANTPEAIGRLADATSQQKLFQLALAFAPTEPAVEEIHYLRSRRTYTTTRRLLSSAFQHVNAVGALTSFDFAQSQASRQIVAARRLLLESECWAALDASRTFTPHGAQLWADLKRVAERLFTAPTPRSLAVQRKTEEATET